MAGLKQGLYTFAEVLLRLCISPRLRAACLRALGASVGTNVRIYECRFINLRDGFKNLRVHDDVHIGTGCLIDLEGPVTIGRRSTISPRVVLISHTDPGSSHNSPWCRRFAVERRGVTIGKDCWIGANATLLSGTHVGDCVTVGAAALVRGWLSGEAVYAGVPARRVN